MHLNPSLRAAGLHTGDADQGALPDESRHALFELGRDAELVIRSSRRSCIGERAQPIFGGLPIVSLSTRRS
jgi:hypothetical protein